MNAACLPWPLVRRPYPRAFCGGSAIAAIASAILSACVVPAHAEDFAPFRVTGVTGYITSGYQSDEFITRQPGFGGLQPPAEKLLQTDLRMEAFLMTQSYIYHPKFLSLDVGGGPVFLAARAEGDGMVNRSRETLYNFTARASFLADKPVRGGLFYEHLNPTIAVSPGETFNQQAEKYGLTFSLLAPVSPLPTTVEATRSHTTGNSASRTMDERIDQLNLKVERAVSNLGITHFGYANQDQTSASGSVNLPLQSSRLRSQSFNADTRLQFGKDRQYELYNNILYTRNKYTLEQGTSPELEEFRFMLNYAGWHSQAWQSFAGYQFSDNRQGDRSTLVNTANVSATWSPVRAYSISAGLRGNDTRASQFATRAWSVDGSARYDQPLPLGSLQASYSVRFDQRDQTAGAARPTVVGERITLSGTVPVSLGQARVAGASVVVQNLTRTQTYGEGTDYLLTVVGETTRIQAVLSGLILDGETVLIDYAFNVGGTYASTQLDQGVNLNWAVGRSLSVYARYNDSAPRVTSGIPTSTLNSIRSTLLGLRADVALGPADEYLAGGFIERENRRETIAPFVRTAGEAYLQGDVPFATGVSFRAGARRTRVDAENLFQGVDLVGYDLLLGLRVGRGLRLSATSVYERDSGGVEPRTRRATTLKGLWRFRQLTFSMDVSQTRETQGAYTRERTLGHINLRRDL